MKVVYLTIDDVSSVDFATKLQFLQALRIPAVLFCIGKQAELQRTTLVKAIQAGFTLGNHSFTHQRFSSLTPLRIQTEISKTDALLNELYAQADIVRARKLFRLPYGDSGGAHAGLVQQLLAEYAYEQPSLGSVTYPFYRQHIASGRRDIAWTFNVMELSIPQSEQASGAP